MGKKNNGNKLDGVSANSSVTLVQIRMGSFLPFLCQHCSVSESMAY